MEERTRSPENDKRMFPSGTDSPTLFFISMLCACVCAIRMNNDIFYCFNNIYIIYINLIPLNLNLKYELVGSPSIASRLLRDWPKPCNHEHAAYAYWVKSKFARR